MVFETSDKRVGNTIQPHLIYEVVTAFTTLTARWRFFCIKNSVRATMFIYIHVSFWYYIFLMAAWAVFVWLVGFSLFQVCKSTNSLWFFLVVNTGHPQSRWPHQCFPNLWGRVGAFLQLETVEVFKLSKCGLAWGSSGNSSVTYTLVIEPPLLIMAEGGLASEDETW